MESLDLRGEASLGPMGLIGRIYVGITRHCYILTVCLRLKFFSVLSLETLDPQGGASLDPRGLIDRIYVGDY